MQICNISTILCNIAQIYNQIPHCNFDFCGGKINFAVNNNGYYVRL